MNDTKKLEQIKKKAEHQSKLQKYFTLFLVIIVVIFFLIMAFHNLFNIKTIEVTGISNEVPYTSEDVSNFLDIKKDTNLITYDSGSAEKALLSEFPYINSVEIKKKLPNVLKVDIVENKGTLFTRLGNDVFILSSDGRVLEIVSDPSYDGVRRTELLTKGVKRCITGEDVVFDKEEKLSSLVEIMKALDDYSMTPMITDIDTTDRFNVKLTYDGRFEIIFGSFEKADQKIKLFSEMMNNKIWQDSKGIIDISDSSEAIVKFTGNVEN